MQDSEDEHYVRYCSEHAGLFFFEVQTDLLKSPETDGSITSHQLDYLEDAGSSRITNCSVILANY